MIVVSLFNQHSTALNTHGPCGEIAFGEVLEVIIKFDKSKQHRQIVRNCVRQN